MSRQFFVPYSHYPLDAIFRACASELEAAVRSLDATALAAAPNMDLADQLVREHSPAVPHLDFAALTATHATRRLPSPHFPGRSRTAPTLLYRIPFRGTQIVMACWSTRLVPPDPVEFFFDGDDLCFELLRERVTEDELTKQRDRHLDHLRGQLPELTRRVIANTGILRLRVAEQLAARARTLLTDGDAAPE